MEDGQVLRVLMTHVILATGLSINEMDDQRSAMAGEYIHLATQEPTAQPGRLRVLLSSMDDVRKLHNALHGQTVKVGPDRIGVMFCDDLMESRGVPGSGQWSRA